MRLECINVCGLRSPWRQGHFIDDFKLGCDYEDYTSLSQLRMGGKLAVLFVKGLDLKVQMIFLDLEGKLVVLDMSYNTFRLITVYSLTGAGQPDFFRDWKVFLGTSRSLMLVGDWNTILDAHLDRVRLSDRKVGNKSLRNQLSYLQLAEQVPAGFPKCTNVDIGKPHQVFKIVSR